MSGIGRLGSSCVSISSSADVVEMPTQEVPLGLGAQPSARRSRFQPRWLVSNAALDAFVNFCDAIQPSDLALQPGNLSSCLRQQSEQVEKLACGT